MRRCVRCGDEIAGRRFSSPAGTVCGGCHEALYPVRVAANERRSGQRAVSDNGAVVIDEPTGGQW